MEEVFERKNVVTNGCNGSCCEAFTFAYYPEDLRLMIAAEERGEKTFIDTLGKERNVYSSKNNNTPMVADMLIPLGHTEINPNGNKVVMDTIIDQDNRSEWIVDIDGKPQLRLFTCKHFDKVNKVCGNYENRPNLCRHFGDNCQYAGCGYASKIMEAYKAMGENLNKDLESQGIDVDGSCVTGVVEG